jgi:hypothetical protein
MNKVKFLGEECTIEFQKYQHGGVAMQLWCSEGPMCKATVCIPGAKIKDNEVLIKNWSENEGILDALISSGIVKDTGKVVPSGYVEANVCEICVPLD